MYRDWRTTRLVRRCFCISLHSTPRDWMYKLRYIVSWETRMASPSG